MYRMKRKIRTRRVARRRMSIHSMVWLIGLVVIALTDGWWPGILILVVISVLLESAVKRGDQSDGDVEVSETVTDEKPEVTPASPPRVETVAPPVGTHRADWLPLSCPKCGGPTRATEVRWTGDASASCPYCGSNLPLKKS